MSGYTNEQVAQIAAVVAQVLANGNFSAPAPVVELAAHKASKKASAKKATAKKAAPVKAAPKAKVEAPAEIREMFAGLAATKDAIKPLNKALASVLRSEGRPWVKATEADAATLKAAYAQLSKSEAAEARKALAARKAAKKS
jgi:DNA-binding protein HU-beta